MRYNGKEIEDMTLTEILRAIADVEEKLGRPDVAKVAERMAEGEEKGMSEDEVIKYALEVEDGE